MMRAVDAIMECLKAEGVPSERIHLVGNIMIDTLMRLSALEGVRAG